MSGHYYSGMQPLHISDHDLERYCLWQVKDEKDLSRLEEHIMGCSSCLDRAEAIQRYVERMKESLMRTNALDHSNLVVMRPNGVETR